MNRALPEMLQCLNTLGTDVTVLERLRARMKWRRRRQGCYAYDESLSSVLLMQASSSRVGDFQDLTATGLPEWGKSEMSGVGFESSGLVLSRASRCPPPPATAEVRRRVTMASVLTSSAAARENSKKRKQKIKVVAESESKDKRLKLSEEDEESNILTEKKDSSKSSRENSGDHTSNQNSKASSQLQKTDYIHVRARRGQATDSHSLAERARREKISERMKYLQSLVPGCDKITGKAGMLDEIINYVQSLQQQVEFLSLKLAALNPCLEFNVDDPFAKQGFPAIGISSEMTNSSYFDQLIGTDEQMVSSCLSIPETLMIDSSSFTQFPTSSTWDADLQSLYNYNVNFEGGGPSSNFQSQQYSGY